MNILETLMHSAMIERLGWTLVHSLWQGAAIVPAAWAGMHLCRTAAQRYVVAMSGLLLMIVLAVTAFAWMGNPSDSAPARMVAANRTLVVRPVTLGQDPVREINDRALMARVAATPALVPAPAESSGDGLSLQNAIPWLVAAWLIGVLALSLWHLGGWIGLQGLRKTASAIDASAARQILTRLAQRLDVRQPVQLVVTDLVRSPIVLGVLRPMILVPVAVATGLSQSQLEAILAHELAHIRRHDYLANLIQCAIETLLFYHPAVWWLSRMARSERENCCDDVAATLCGDRVLYARALLSVDELRGTANGLAMGANGGSLKTRIHRMLGVHDAARRRQTLPAALLVLAAILAAIVLPWPKAHAAAPAPPVAAGAPAATPSPEAATIPAPRMQTLTGKILLPDGNATADLGLFVDASQLGVDRETLNVDGTPLNTKDTPDGWMHMTAPPSPGILESKPEADGSFSIMVPAVDGTIALYAETDDRRLALYKKISIKGKDAKADLGPLKLEKTQTVDVTLTDAYGNPFTNAKGVDIDPPGFRGSQYDMSKAMQGRLFSEQNRKFYPDSSGLLRIQGIIPGQTYNLQQASQINDLMAAAGGEEAAAKRIPAGLNWNLVTLIPEKGPRPATILLTSQLPVRIVDEAGKPVAADSIQSVQVVTGEKTAWTNGTPVVINDHLPEGWILIDRVNIFFAKPDQTIIVAFTSGKQLQKKFTAKGTTGGDASRLNLVVVPPTTRP